MKTYKMSSFVSLTTKDCPELEINSCDTGTKLVELVIGDIKVMVDGYDLRDAISNALNKGSV